MSASLSNSANTVFWLYSAGTRAYFYCLTAGARLNTALSAVQISRWLSNLFHDVKFRQLVTQLVLTLGQ